MIGSIGNKVQVPKALGTSSYLIQGLMKYASKFDLINYLNKVKIIPKHTDAILDYRHTPTGQWIITLDDKENVDILTNIHNNNINKKPTHISLLNLRNGIKLDNKISLRKLAYSEHQRLMVTSQLNITDRTICIHMVPPYFKIDHVRQVFDGYDIDTKVGIRPWSPRRTAAPTYSYLIDFVSAAEAERACREKSATIHDGAIMRITWYNV